MRLVPRWAGQFNSFEEWVDHATRRLTDTPEGVSYQFAPFICVDARGRRCWQGSQFQRARDEGAFPVRYFWECEVMEEGPQLVETLGAIPRVKRVNELAPEALVVLAQDLGVEMEACACGCGELIWPWTQTVRSQGRTWAQGHQPQVEVPCSVCVAPNEKLLSWGHVPSDRPGFIKRRASFLWWEWWVYEPCHDWACGGSGVRRETPV